jgi:hypothetical protein
VVVAMVAALAGGARPLGVLPTSARTSPRPLPAPLSSPSRHGAYYYYSRTREGQQYRVHCRRRVPPSAGPPSESDALDLSQPEEVLLDENARKVGGWAGGWVGGRVWLPRRPWQLGRAGPG